MRIPVVQGMIDRRILVNYRVDAEVLARLLPEPFRPQQVRGYGIAGICLIRLQQVRPRHLPRFVGLASENAAHRIAVDWEQDGERYSGVYIPRRDTSSRLNYWLGGRLFPGVHHQATFVVQEEAGQYRVDMASRDGISRLSVAGHMCDQFPAASVFSGLDEASAFFERGAVGYSATTRPGHYDGLELRCIDWQMRPLVVEHVASSFFANRRNFPLGSAEFDCALLMTHVHHEWHGRRPLCLQSAMV